MGTSSSDRCTFQFFDFLEFIGSSEQYRDCSPHTLVAFCFANRYIGVNIALHVYLSKRAVKRQSKQLCAAKHMAK